MMKPIRYILSCCMLLWAYGMQAQIQLHVDPQALSPIDGHSYVLNDTLPTGTSVSVTLYNNSNSPFNDSLGFGYSITSSGITTGYNTRAYAGAGINAAGPVFAIIPAGTSYTYQALNFQFRSPVFEVGPTTVVIWPTLYHNGSSIGDSASANVNIDRPTGIGEVSANNPMVYMSGSKLIIRDTENAFGDIRIYDLSGRLVLSQALTGDGYVPMQPYADGMYTIELAHADGGRQIYKVIKRSDR